MPIKIRNNNQWGASQAPAPEIALPESTRLALLEEFRRNHPNAFTDEQYNEYIALKQKEQLQNDVETQAYREAHPEVTDTKPLDWHNTRDKDAVANYTGTLIFDALRMIPATKKGIGMVDKANTLYNAYGVVTDALNQGDYAKAIVSALETASEFEKKKVEKKAISSGGPYKNAPSSQKKKTVQ